MAGDDVSGALERLPSAEGGGPAATPAGTSPGPGATRPSVFSYPPAAARRSDPADRRREARLLAVLTMALVTIASLPLMAPSVAMDWRAQWLVGIFVAVGAAFGAFQLFGEEEPRGVPVESLITPGLVALAIYAAVPAAVWLGVHPALALVVIVAAGLVLMRTALDAELPFVRLGGVTAAGDRRTVEALLLAAAFLCFIGVAATLPGGWPLPELDHPGGPLVDSVVAIGVADAVIAFFVGYRLTALSGSVAAVGWASGTYGVLVGAAAVLFRWLAIPGLMGPALLAVVLYLRSILRLRSAPPDRAVRWQLEAVVLGLVIVAVVAYQLLARP
jgi:hypothetical protein